MLLNDPYRNFSLKFRIYETYGIYRYDEQLASCMKGMYREHYSMTKYINLYQLVVFCCCFLLSDT